MKTRLKGYMGKLLRVNLTTSKAEEDNLPPDTILRDYLELQFDIAAPVQTTTELLQVVETGRYMNAETTQGFAELFENSDLARFAGLQLTHAELSKAIDDARRLIEQTSMPTSTRSAEFR